MKRVFFLLVALLLLLAAGGRVGVAQEAAETPDATPIARKGRPYPFNSVVFSFDRELMALRIGKRHIRLVYIVPETRITLADGDPATVEELIDGREIRGSIRKREDGELEVVSIKIGTKILTPDR